MIALNDVTVNTGFHVFVAVPGHYIPLQMLTTRYMCGSLSLGGTKIFSGGKVPNFDFPNRSLTLKRINFRRIKKEAVIDFRGPFAILSKDWFLANCVEKTF